MSRFAAVLWLVLLGGCATSTGSSERWAFEKPGVSEAQKKRDQSECFAQSVDPETNKPGLMRMDRGAYRACMEARGYALRAEPR